MPLVATTTSLAFYPRQWPIWRERRRGRKNERMEMMDQARIILNRNSLFPRPDLSLFSAYLFFFFYVFFFVITGTVKAPSLPDPEGIYTARVRGRRSFHPKGHLRTREDPSVY